MHDIIVAIQNRAWYPLVGILLWHLLALWKRYNGKGEVLPRLPDGWRWLPPVFLAFAGGFSDAYYAGLPWWVACIQAVYAVLAVAGPAMGLQGALKESPVAFSGTGAGGKALPLVLLAALSLPAVSGCTGKGPDTAAMVERSGALAFNGAVLALEILDAKEADYIDGLAQPTDEQIKRATGRVERLIRARDALAIVREWMEGKRGDAKPELAEAAKLLRVVAEELKADGVNIPDRVLQGLKLAELFAGVAS